MPRPQQEELARSGRTDLDPDHAETRVGARAKRAPRDEEAGLDVPEENRPGHRPERDQDQPDPDAVARRLGTTRRPRAGRALGAAAAWPLQAAAVVVDRALRLVEKLPTRRESADR